MPKQKTREVTRHRESDESAGDPIDESPGDLRQQAAELAKIAREARDDCKTGADAEQELMRRRNRSGQ